MENSTDTPKRLKRELPYDPEVPLPRINPEKRKTLIRKNICTPMFIAALSIIAKIWKQPKCALLDERIKKLQHIQLYIHIHIAVVCIHSEILLSH